MLTPPEKGGPSPTPDRGPLVTPACPLSANPEAAISIVGNSADLTRMMQRLLLDDTVARAVASLLPSGAQELSIRETKTKAPKGEQTNRGFSIEVPAKIRSQQLRDVVCQLALRESVVSDLSTLAATGSLPSGSHEKLSLLAKAITGQELPDESQLRAAITRCFASTLPAIAERSQLAARHASAVACPRSTLTIQTGTCAVDGALAGLAKLRALAWLDAADDSYEKFCERGESIVSMTVAALSAFWDSAIGRRDLGDVPEVIRLYSRVRTALQEGCFDQLPPRFLLPSAADVPESISSAAKIHRILNRTPGRVGALAPFLPLMKQELPLVIQSLERSLGLMRAGAAWTPDEKSDSDGELFEALMNSLPAAVESLNQLQESLVGELPPALTQFVEVLIRLRFHGSNEGLMSLHIITTPLTSRAQQDALVANPEHFTETNIRSLCDIVEFAASWSVREPAVRAEILERQMTPLCEVFARTISVLSANFSLTSSACMRERRGLPPDSAEQLLNDIGSFERSLPLLAPHIRNPALVKSVADLPSGMLGPLRIAFSMLTQPQDGSDLMARIEQVLAWPSSFGDSPYEQQVKQYRDSVRGEVLQEAADCASSLASELAISSERGDIEGFAAALDQFMQLANVIGIDSELIKDRAALVDRLALELINEIHEAFERDLATVSSKLPSGSASPAEIAQGVENLSLQLSQFASLKECLLKHERLVKPARVNHLQSRVTGVISRHSRLAVHLVRTLCNGLQESSSDESLRTARLLLRSRDCARLLRNIAPSELLKLDNLVSQKLQS